MRKHITSLKHVIKRHPRRSLALLFVLVILVGVGVYFATKPSVQPAQAEVITNSTDTPDEDKPENYNWQGGPTDPKYIDLPTISASGFIQRAGVDQNKQIAVPNNVHLAAWFIDSVRPGEKGLSIIDGHVTGRTTDGIFKNLGAIQEGAEFTVERGDGTVLRYEVMDIVTLPADKSASALFSQNPKVTNQLNLITCGGDFDTSADQYKDRIIVSAKQL